MTIKKVELAVEAPRQDGGPPAVRSADCGLRNQDRETGNSAALCRDAATAIEDRRDLDHGWIQLSTSAVFEGHGRADLPQDFAFERWDFAVKPPFTVFYRFRRGGVGSPRSHGEHGVKRCNGAAVEGLPNGHKRRHILKSQGSTVARPPWGLDASRYFRIFPAISTYFLITGRKINA
jgi:hypothetical protein